MRKKWRCCFASSDDLKARGLGIVFITHFLEQVYETFSDRITVLRNGQLVGTREIASLPRRELDDDDARP